MSAYSDRVIADGAVYYWRLGDAGFPVVDAVGGAHGANAGSGGSAVVFSRPGALADGDTAIQITAIGGGFYVGLPAVTLPAIGSVEAWVKATSADSVMAWTNRSSATPSQGYFGLAAGGLPIFGNGAPNAHTATGAPVNDGAWHHLVGVSDGTVLRIYVDGVPRGTRANLGLATTGLGKLGADDFVGVTPVSLDEVAIYGVALTPATITAHYALATASAGGGRPISLGAWKQALH